jgi:hypothetical protein
MSLHITLQQEFSDETFERTVHVHSCDELVELIGQILSAGDRGGLRVDCLIPERDLYRVSWKELRTVVTEREVP